MQAAESVGQRMQKSIHTQKYRCLLNLLRKARQEAGLTQQQLAAKLEASQDEISKCETGIRRLDVIELKLWVEALGLQLPDFIAKLD